MAAFSCRFFGRADVPASLCLAPAEIPAKIGATGAASFVAGLYPQVVVRFRGYRLDDPDLNMLVQRVLGASRDAGCRTSCWRGRNSSNSDARRVRSELGLVPVSLEVYPWRRRSTCLAETLRPSPATNRADDDGWKHGWSWSTADPADREAA